MLSFFALLLGSRLDLRTFWVTGRIQFRERRAVGTRSAIDRGHQFTIISNEPCQSTAGTVNRIYDIKENGVRKILLASRNNCERCITIGKSNLYSIIIDYIYLLLLR